MVPTWLHPTRKHLLGAALSNRWRLRFPEASRSSNNFVEIQETEWRATVGGPDQCNGGTATASSTYSVGDYAPAYAFANDGSSKVWSSEYVGGVGLNSWLEYQFPEPVTIGQIMIRAAATSGPKMFILEYWDGSEWVIHHIQETSLTWTGAERLFTVIPYVQPEPAYSKWKITWLDGPTSGTFIQTPDIRLMETSGGEDRAYGGIATDDAHYSTLPASNAFDLNETGSNYAIYNVETPIIGKSIFYELYMPRKIQFLRFRPNTVNNTPKRFSVSYYDPDLDSYVQVLDTGPLTWASTADREFSWTL